MAAIPDPSEGRSSPRHHFFAEAVQYRAKVQAFSHVPCEVTVQRIDFEQDQRRYLQAAERGLSRVPVHRGRRDPDKPRDAESLERSQRRAKIGVRLRVTELAPSALVTFTTRKVYPFDALVAIWEGFVRRVRMVVPGVEYVAVPEPHPRNPDHFHIHAAWRGRVSIETLRRLWHITLEAFEGRRVTVILRGPAAPGNIDVQRVKGRDTVRRIRKIARYISKYITKDLIERFNRRRYWPSKGITLQGARVFWLDSLSQADAIREAAEMLGHWNGFAVEYGMFCPSERIAWWAVDPDPPS